MAKKKALLGVVCLAMVAIIAVFGTVAYLTDRDAETNVFTSGDVSIDLKEEFKDGAELLPGVPVDKKATVTNIGKNDAWVWVTVAVPEELSSVIEITGTANTWTKEATSETQIKNKNYATYTFFHTDALGVNEATEAAFTTVTLKNSVDVDPNGNWFEVTSGTANALEWSDNNGKPVIYVAAYAIQKDTFTDVKDAYAAYNKQWGTNHNADYETMIYTYEELVDALAEEEEYISIGSDIVIPDPLNVSAGVTINGNGNTITRAANYDGIMFAVKAGASLTMENVTVDGGAVWTGAVDPVLGRGTVNSGMTASGAIVAAEANSKIVLEEGAVLQNNAGANAVNLGTRVGATLTINGGEIINNSSAAGAIWGGGEITLNSGKVNGNYGDLGGAIRVVTNVGTVLTMNGGEMNHNYSAAVGGAIWAGSSKSNNVYVLNGGEMAYNYSAVAGGAMYPGYYETVNIGGTFKMHDNSAPTAGAIRFHNHASLNMTGGEIYDNGDNSLFLLNNSASIIGGKISDNFGFRWRSWSYRGRGGYRWCDRL